MLHSPYIIVMKPVGASCVRQLQKCPPQDMSANNTKTNVRHKICPQKKHKNKCPPQDVCPQKNTKTNVRHKLCSQKKHKKKCPPQDASAKNTKRNVCHKICPQKKTKRNVRHKMFKTKLQEHFKNTYRPTLEIQLN